MTTAPSLRVALCQIDTIVGALDHNTDLAIAALRQAELAGCDVAIFPELTIPGYPPDCYSMSLLGPDRTWLAHGS